MSTPIITSAKSLPTAPENATGTGLKKSVIKSESGEVDLLNGFMQLNYYESLLQDSIFVDFMFVDSGNTLKGKSTMEGLPVHSSEDFTLEFSDNNDVLLKGEMIVNKVTSVNIEDNKTVVTLHLVTEEFIKNEESKTHCNKRMDGKISDNVKLILEDENYLATEKKLDIEETDNNYNFFGNGRKAFYTMNWLSTKSVPSKDGKKGESAGFILWETSKGYHFKSIDALFAQKPKKKFIFTATSDAKEVPADYDGKILEHFSDNRINLQNKFKMGAYGTKLIRFDPFNCFYEVVEQKAEETKEGTTNAGKDLPKINKKFGEPTRTTYMLVDKGTLPSGDTEEQIEKNEEENFESSEILNQGIRRYNQMFSVMETITIGGDYDLHAGDAIWIDFPSIERDHESNEMNKQNGGLYIISDLCHYVTPKETYTKMNIIRDSFGRDPKKK